MNVQCTFWIFPPFNHCKNAYVIPPFNVCGALVLVAQFFF